MTIKNPDEDKYLDIYKIQRASVEHFDRLLGSLRAIVFGFNGIVIGGVLAIFGQAIIKAGETKAPASLTHIKLLFAGSVFFTVMNLLFWALEKHYHRYLIVSSKISALIEKKLTLDKNIQLTHQLKQVRDNDHKDDTIPHFLLRKLSKISRYFRTYDFLYLFPSSVAVGLNFYLSATVSINEVDPSNLPGFWLTSKMLITIYLCTIYVIMRRTHWINYHYADTLDNDFLNTEKQKQIFDMKQKRPLFFKFFSSLVTLIGLSLIVIAICDSMFNNYYFFVIVSTGFFLSIVGRCIFVQKNWARESFFYFIIISAGIVIYFCAKNFTNVDKSVMVITTILSSLVLVYLLDKKTILIFKRGDGKFNN